MNDQFFPEMARRLKREGISTGAVEKGCLPVLMENQTAVLVMPRGTVMFNADVERSPEADRVYDLTYALSREVYEYTEAMAAAPPLKAEGLHEGFRLLADFNGVVLAGQELEGDWGYKFATWRRSPDRTAVESGDYFDGGHHYEAAKLDFACRAGLVQESRQFTDEQLTELYRCVWETLDSDPITRERENILKDAMGQIENSVEDLDERVSLSNQRELEAADSLPDMGMSP